MRCGMRNQKLMNKFRAESMEPRWRLQVLQTGNTLEVVLQELVGDWLRPQLRSRRPAR